MQNPPKNFLIIGAGYSSLSEYIRAHGHRYTLLKDSSRRPDANKPRKNTVLADFSDKSAVLELAGRLHNRQKFDGVLVVYEHYVATAAEIARSLGLPSLPPEAAEACTNKIVMRQKFAAAPEKISPDFAMVDTEQTLRRFAAAHDFPLILKPANLSKSLLVTKNNSLDELLANYQRTLANITEVYARYAPGATPLLLVEEFMEGSVHSIDAFVDSGGTVHLINSVVDYQTGHDIGYDDNFHYSRLLPSKLDTPTLKAIKHVATLGCQALGMKNSPAHIEIILTEEGPRIVEIGARNGGYRERMHRLSNDIDIIGNYLQIATGNQPALKSKKNDPVAVLELFPKSPGIFSGVTHEDDLKKLPSLYYYSLKAKPKVFAGKSSDGYKACAIIILHHKDQAQFAKDLQFVNKYVAIATT